MQKEEKILSLLRSRELEIDQEGRIWRIAKRQGGLRGPNGEYLKGTKICTCKRVRAEYSDKQGYLLIAVMINGKRSATGAHRVVWTHFNSTIPDGMTINHKNGKKDDNRPENLEVATYSENRRHALTVLNVNRSQPKGSLHPKTHIVESDALEIRKLRAAGIMIRVIAAKYGMTKKAISAICNRHTWKHI